MKVLRMGDPHVRPNNLEDCERLMQFTVQMVKAHSVDRLEILGDLFHTHAVLRLEVLEFWDKWLHTLSELVQTVILVGNHDQTGDFKSKSHALSVFKRASNDKLAIIDRPTKIGAFGYLPYHHSADEFIANARTLANDGAKVLVCHQTFDGSVFEGGFYAPDGIDIGQLPFDTIVSGHIHKQQIIGDGKVDYPGTPKWDTTADANEAKGLWLYEYEGTKTTKREILPTNQVCTPILAFTWVEGEAEPDYPTEAKVAIELVGSSAWIAKKKANFKGKVSVKSRITDKERKITRKVGNNLHNYLSTGFPTDLSRQKIIDLAMEIGIV